MSNLNNEERLKILRARLDEIQQKNFSNENLENEKEKVVETTTSSDKNTSKNNVLKYVIISALVGFGLIYLFTNVIDIKTKFEFETDKITNDSPTKVEESEKIVEVEENISYKFNLNENFSHLIITTLSYSEEEAKKMADKYTSEGYQASAFYIPDNSNSSQELFKIKIGPYYSIEEAEQWNSTLEEETKIIAL
ncbi:SPOR domain-containing protein [Bacteroidota bacterium]|nr:SPOR domain-containing protein [Bacteroidota bacterium]